MYSQIVFHIVHPGMSGIQLVPACVLPLTRIRQMQMLSYGLSSISEIIPILQTINMPSKGSKVIINPDCGSGLSAQNPEPDAQQIPHHYRSGMGSELYYSLMDWDRAC